MANINNIMAEVKKILTFLPAFKDGDGAWKTRNEMIPGAENSQIPANGQ